MRSGAAPPSGVQGSTWGGGEGGEGLGSNEELSERCTGGSMLLIWCKLGRCGEGWSVRGRGGQ